MGTLVSWAERELAEDREKDKIAIVA